MDTQISSINKFTNIVKVKTFSKVVNVCILEGKKVFVALSVFYSTMVIRTRNLLKRVGYF